MIKPRPVCERVLWGLRIYGPCRLSDLTRSPLGIGGMELVDAMNALLIARLAKAWFGATMQYDITRRGRAWLARRAEVVLSENPE